MKTWNEHFKELMKDPEFKKAYDDLEEEYKLAEAIIKARLAKNLSQAELAKRAGVSRMAVSRLESGISNPTYETVSRVANVLDKKLELVNIR